MAKKQDKTTTTTVQAAVRETLGIKPYSSFTEMGSEIGTGYFSAAERAARVALTIGAAYDAKTGIPVWGKLDTALTDSGSKATKADILRGLVTRWDAQPDPNGSKAKALAAAGIPDGSTCVAMTLAARQAHYRGNDARKVACQELLNIINMYASKAWNHLVDIDNQTNGRIKPRGSNKVTDVEKSLRGTKVESLPSRVAKLIDDGFAVDTFWKDLAAMIIKAKRAGMTKTK